MSGDTYIVALKMPGGLILQNHELVETTEPSPAGSKTVKMARKIGPSFRLRGYNESMTKASPLVVPTYARTPDVPAAIVDLWVKDHHDADVLVNGLMIYGRTDKEVDAKIADRAAGICGLEPLATSADGIVDKRVNVLKRAEIKGIGTADEQPPFTAG